MPELGPEPEQGPEPEPEPELELGQPPIPEQGQPLVPERGQPLVPELVRLPEQVRLPVPEQELARPPEQELGQPPVPELGRSWPQRRRQRIRFRVQYPYARFTLVITCCQSPPLFSGSNTRRSSRLDCAIAACAAEIAATSVGAITSSCALAELRDSSRYVRSACIAWEWLSCCITRTAVANESCNVCWVN